METTEKLLETIIIIENDKKIADTLKTSLEKAGYAVTCLFTYRDAIDHLSGFIRMDMNHVVAVVLEYTLDHERQITSIPLMGIFKRIKTFKGVLLANSQEQFFNNFLKEAGCTHARPGTDKTDVVPYLVEILKPQKE